MWFISTRFKLYFWKCGKSFETTLRLSCKKIKYFILQFWKFLFSLFCENQTELLPNITFLVFLWYSEFWLSESKTHSRNPVNCKAFPVLLNLYYMYLIRLTALSNTLSKLYLNTFFLLYLSISISSYVVKWYILLSFMIVTGYLQILDTTYIITLTV